MDTKLTLKLKSQTGTQNSYRTFAFKLSILNFYLEKTISSCLAKIFRILLVSGGGGDMRELYKFKINLRS